MSYMLLKLHRIRENGKKRSVFDKVNEIKRDIKAILPEIEEDKLTGIMSRIRNEYRYKNKVWSSKYKPKELTFNERLVYDYLLKNNLNPSTVYLWFLASRIPVDIQSMLKGKKISLKTALHLSANRLRNRLSKEGLLMIEEIRQIIRKY